MPIILEKIDSDQQVLGLCRCKVVFEEAFIEELKKQTSSSIVDQGTATDPTWEAKKTPKLHSVYVLFLPQQDITPPNSHKQAAGPHIIQGNPSKMFHAQWSILPELSRNALMVTEIDWIEGTGM